MVRDHRSASASATIGGSRKRRGGGGLAFLRLPTSLHSLSLSHGIGTDTRWAKGRTSTGSAGDQGADRDLPGDQTSGRGGAPPLGPTRA